MKIKVLIENHVSHPQFVAEHGLSFYIESGGKSVLFDTGSTKNFSKNAHLMHIDLSSIGQLVISHGHYDHTGGVERFFELNKNARLLLKKDALCPKYNSDRFIGIQWNSVHYDSRIVFVDKLMEIIPRVYIVDSVKVFNPADQHIRGFFTEYEKDRKDPDKFTDELFICIVKNGALTVISSCSHNGITNICRTASELFSLPVKKVIGGFHLKNASKEEVDLVADYFTQHSVEKIFTGHCTGIEAYCRLKETLKERLEYMQTGTVINI
jgi:7,8-dihydropterin-6-yl-methyl-4-(beta-D-ribofuranosyl)aminobenzene 5'-phosphate synthase